MKQEWTLKANTRHFQIYISKNENSDIDFNSLTSHSVVFFLYFPGIL